MIMKKIFLGGLFLILFNCAFAQSKEKLDTSYITQDAFIGAYIYPARILNIPAMQMVSPLLQSQMAQIKSTLGFDLRDVDQLSVVVRATKDDASPVPIDIGMVITLSKPFDISMLLPAMKKEEIVLDGKKFYLAKDTKLFNALGLVAQDDRTCLIGFQEMIRSMLANHSSPTGGRLSDVLSHYDQSANPLAIALVEPMRATLSKIATSAPLPPVLTKALKLKDEIISIGLKVSSETGFQLAARCVDKDSATRAVKTLNGFIDMVISYGETEIKRISKSETKRWKSQKDIEISSIKQFISDIDLLRPSQTNDRLLLQPSSEDIKTILGALQMQITPAVEQARIAARRSSSMNRMKQILLAMHNYADKHSVGGDNFFPCSAIRDAEGKPLLSWRVVILPYLGEEELYRKFHLDEPWDSDHNKALLNQMPEVFCNPNSNAAINLATYLMPNGTGAVGELQKDFGFASLKDGASRTVILVEVNDDQAVPWTKPMDWEFSQDNPLDGIGDAHPGNVFGIGLADGCVLGKKADVLDKNQWKAALTYAGGETEDPIYNE